MHIETASQKLTGRAVADTGIALVAVIQADRDEFERGLFTQGYTPERARELAHGLDPHDAALQMLARHRIAAEWRGKISSPIERLSENETARANGVLDDIAPLSISSTWDAFERRTIVRAMLMYGDLISALPPAGAE